MKKTPIEGTNKFEITDQVAAMDLARRRRRRERMRRGEGMRRRERIRGLELALIFLPFCSVLYINTGLEGSCEY